MCTIWYGENEDLERTCKQEGTGNEFEYTSPDTPQQNSPIQQNFANLFNRAHVMVNNGKFPLFLRNRLWAEAANTKNPSEK